VNCVRECNLADCKKITASNAYSIEISWQMTGAMNDCEDERSEKNRENK